MSRECSLCPGEVLAPVQLLKFELDFFVMWVEEEFMMTCMYDVGSTYWMFPSKRSPRHGCLPGIVCHFSRIRFFSFAFFFFIFMPCFSSHSAPCPNTPNKTAIGKPSVEGWSPFWFKMHANRQYTEWWFYSVWDLTARAGRIIQTQMNPV